MIRLTLFVVALLFCSVFTAAKQYSGYGPMGSPGQVQHSGRFTVNNKTGKALFYWMAETTSKAGAANVPLHLFLSGGPGCASSGTANIFEKEGPMTLNEKTGEIEPSPAPWTEFANVLWLDQPCGVGFSTCGTGPQDTNIEEAAEDFYNFLQSFMEYYPQYRNLKVTIEGESFGGTWATMLAHRVWAAGAGRAPAGKYPIRLDGLVLGDGLTVPTYQYPQYPELAYNWCKVVKGKPCVSEETYNQMKAALPKCLELINLCTTQNVTSVCEEATSYCNAQEMDPYMETGLNFYNILLEGNYNMDQLTKFMNKEDVQMSLVGEKWKWEMCNYTVNAVYSRSWEHDRSQAIIDMLEGGVRVLLFAGALDFAVNWLGVKNWAINLAWSGQSSFVAQPDTPFYVNNLMAGSARSIATKGGKMGFSFVQILNAGHLSPRDAPVQVRDMLIHFANDEPYFGYTGPLYPIN